MRSTIKIHVPPSQQVMRNRTYNRHMRNLYYEKSNYQFRKIKKSMDAKTLPEELNLLPELYEFLEHLDVCQFYAKQAVYCNKSEKIVPYSQDHHWGIMQEEVLLVYFLEEQISSARYVLNHIETNIKIQAFAKKSENDVIVHHILSNIDEMNRDTEKDLRYFCENIEKRYKIGNKLFGILQELQNFQ
jgi:hypothetical protein